MTTPVKGILQSNTIGWDHRLDAGAFVLLPVTIITVISIIAIATAIKPARAELQDNHYANSVCDAIPFDSSNTMHLVVATSAGCLGNVLRGFRKIDMAKAGRTRVELRCVNDEVALVADSESVC
jgi:hypothetical protein